MRWKGVPGFLTQGDETNSHSHTDRNQSQKLPLQTRLCKSSIIQANAAQTVCPRIVIGKAPIQVLEAIRPSFYIRGSKIQARRGLDLKGKNCEAISACATCTNVL